MGRNIPDLGGSGVAGLGLTGRGRMFRDRGVAGLRFWWGQGPDGELDPRGMGAGRAGGKGTLMH